MALKQKTCGVCKNEYTPFNSMQKVCGPRCAIDLARKDKAKAEAKKEKAEAKVWREKKKALSDTAPIWKKKAQAVFNKYIRMRDHDRPCVSCGKYERELKHNSSGGLWDCGHYRSVGSCPELRFEELNAHKQCKKCNQFLSGNHVEYRFGIASRITPEELDFIEGPHEPKRYRVNDLKGIHDEFKQKLKDLERLGE